MRSKKSKESEKNTRGSLYDCSDFSREKKNNNNNRGIVLFQSKSILVLDKSKEISPKEKKYLQIKNLEKRKQRKKKCIYKCI